GNGSRNAASRMAGATRRGECDDGNDLDRRSRRAIEETLGGRAFGQPDRRGTRKCDPKCGYRQGPPVGPFRPRQESLFGGTAPAQGPPGPAHDAGLAAGLARQYRARARFRPRTGAGSYRLRQRGADEPAAVATATERGHLPLADRRSRQFGILLLWRQGADRPALLRASLADRLSAGLRPPPPAAEVDEVISVIARSESDEAIHAGFTKMDCFASLAMTPLGSGVRGTRIVIVLPSSLRRYLAKRSSSA